MSSVSINMRLPMVLHITLNFFPLQTWSLHVQLAAEKIENESLSSAPPDFV